jgi:hypothetical protein
MCRQAIFLLVRSRTRQRAAIRPVSGLQLTSSAGPNHTYPASGSCSLLPAEQCLGLLSDSLGAVLGRVAWHLHTLRPMLR